MNPMLQQFTSVALPIILAFAIAAWLQNKRLDDIVRRLDAIEKRLAAIEARLSDLSERIVRLEERTSPVLKR